MMKECIKALNVLYTYDKTYEPYLILWIFPLQVCLSVHLSVHMHFLIFFLLDFYIFLLILAGLQCRITDFWTRTCV